MADAYRSGESRQMQDPVGMGSAAYPGALRLAFPRR